MNLLLSSIASSAPSEKPENLNPSSFERSEKSLSYEFKIYREEEVSVTSTLFCGGDWRWQLCSSRGFVLAKAGGFATERECRDAVAMLKNNAAQASVVVN